jgi:hypothetical protein
MDECRAVYDALRGIDGVELLEEPAEAFWGGGFSWRDPEGNIWDVAWARDARLDERGGVFFPLNRSSLRAVRRTWLYFPAAWLPTISCRQSPESGSKAPTAS